MFNQGYSSLYSSKGAFLGAIALSITATSLVSCTQPEVNEQVQTDVTTEDVAEESEQAQTDVTTEDISEETEALIGETVTVRSGVEEEIGDSGFTIETNALIGGEPILVINATGTPFVIPTDDTAVQVTGEVAQFVIVDVESEFDLDLDEDLYLEYEDRPAIIAQSLALAPEPDELSEDPTAYYGRVVAVEGEVGEIYSPSLFSIGDDGWFDGVGLLTVGVNPDFDAGASEISEGDTVRVVGELRQFVVSDFERDYDLTWDSGLVSELEVEYSEKPVLAATEVYPSAVEE